MSKVRHIHYHPQLHGILEEILDAQGRDGWKLTGVIPFSAWSSILVFEKPELRAEKEEVG